MGRRDLSIWGAWDLNCPVPHFPNDFPLFVERSRTVKEVYECWETDEENSRSRPQGQAVGKGNKDGSR
eukprot:12337336-Alexandrium_andersonii.AAC.1